MSAEKTRGPQRRTDQTRASLLHEIDRGRFAASDRLPGEREMAQLLSVSRTTVRRALAGLIEDGRVEQRHGFGSFVVRPVAASTPSPPVHPALPETLGDTLLRRGDALGSRVLATGIFQPRRDEAMVLDLAPGEPVWRMSRIWLAERDAPVAYEEVTSAAGVGRANGSAIIPATLPQVVRTIHRVRARCMTPIAAAALELPEDTIGSFIEERGVDAARRCCVFARLTQPLPALDWVFDTLSAPSGHRL